MSQWKRIRGAWVHTGKPVGFAGAKPSDSPFTDPKMEEIQSDRDKRGS